MVNLDLKLSYKEEKKSKHGMLRDNICWTAISDKITTRSDAICCQKWYDQLTSSLVVEYEWADADDYRLINALYELDASCIEDVNWDSLLEHRGGDVCRKRWNQMVLHIGYHKTQSFVEQVEVLTKWYCPDLIEDREGLVDSDTLPLNVSREMLQQHNSLKTINKKLVRKALDMICKLTDPDEIHDKDKKDVEESNDSDEKKGQYTKFWNEFRKSIKLGIIEDATNRNRLSNLRRFER